MKTSAQIEKSILKYFNLVIAILMLVVFSLCIEQLLHNQRIFKPDSYKVFKIASSNVSDEIIAHAVDNIEYKILTTCHRCQEESLKLLKRFNSNTNNLYFDLYLIIFSLFIHFL